MKQILKMNLKRMRINGIYHYDGIIIFTCSKCNREVLSDLSIIGTYKKLYIDKCPYCKHKFKEIHYESLMEVLKDE